MDQNQQAPQQPVTPPEPQVVPTPGQKVQYVIEQKSLYGIGGWLLFFMIVFGLAGIGYISLGVTAISTGFGTASNAINAIFYPLLAIAYLASLILLILRKKLGVLVTYITFGIAAVFSVLQNLTEQATSGIAAQIGYAITAVVLFFLLALYFKQSRRVKETINK